MAGFRCKMPNAIFTTGIVIRVVGRADRSRWRGDLIFAAALFAVMTVLVKRETVVARALIGTYRIFAFVLTPSVVIGTFVHIRKEYGSEARFLDAIQYNIMMKITVEHYCANTHGMLYIVLKL